MPIYNAALLAVDANETKRYAGLAKAAFDENRILRACQEAQILSIPKGTWETFDYDSHDHIILSNPPITIEGDKIITYLHNAKKVVLLTVTIGEAIEQAIGKRFKTGDYSDSVLLDAAATTAVETAADQMENTIRVAFTAKGYQVKPRFSPGYGGWDLSIQPQLLLHSHAKSIGVQATDHFMLIPRKSVTAIIALNDHTCEPAIKRSCESCTLSSCFARKEHTL